MVTARDMQEYKIGISSKVLMSLGRSHQIFDQISRFHDEITNRIINVIKTAAILTQRQQNRNCTKSYCSLLYILVYVFINIIFNYILKTMDLFLSELYNTNWLLIKLHERV